MVDRRQAGRNPVRSLVLILAFATLAASQSRATEADPRCAPLHNNIVCLCALQAGGDVQEPRGGGALHAFLPRGSESAYNACLQAARGPRASAGPHMKVVEASSGAPTLLFTWYNCTSHRPYQGTASVINGTLTYKNVVKNICGNSDEPAREIWYTPNPGFTGTDKAITHNVLHVSIIVH
jgi:hypothetical protein